MRLPLHLRHVPATVATRLDTAVKQVLSDANARLAADGTASLSDWQSSSTVVVQFAYAPGDGDGGGDGDGTTVQRIEAAVQVAADNLGAADPTLPPIGDGDDNVSNLSLIHI